jgi:hypothetical protein
MLREVSSQTGDYKCRTQSVNIRSASIEIKLQPGIYEVLPMIEATKYDGLPLVETVVRNNSATNPWKLRQIGLNYDMAHLKGAFNISETAKQGSERNLEVNNELPITTTAMINLLNDFKSDLQDSIAQILGEQNGSNGTNDQLKPKIPAPYWNAVAVIGLRVYSKDDVNIRLAKRGNLADATLLNGMK